MSQDRQSPTPKKKRSIALESRVSRRDFLKTAGSGIIAGAVAATIPLTASRAYAQGAWDDEYDVVVVGSGAAALSAAATARHEGLSVVVLEKAAVPGGTSARSGGGYWIPNNRDLRAAGIEDPRDDALRYMARYSFPHLYDPNHETLGLPRHNYDLIASFYDHAAPAVEYLEEIGALASEAELPGKPDYAEHLPENRVPLGGRTMYPKRFADSLPFGGGEMIRQLSTYLGQQGVEIRTFHRVQRLVKNDAGAVVGVEADVQESGEVAIRARRGVIFGTGGFTHHPQMMLDFQPFGTYGGCAVPSNTGDFVTMATEIGARLGNMNGAFRLQVVLDQALEYSSILTDVWQPPGDSMVLVNKYGRRAVNEKRPYNERTRAHYDYDASRADYPNRLLFMVWDQRTAELYANRFPIPAAGAEAPFVVSGETFAELATNLSAHIDTLRGKIGPIANLGAFDLDEGFAANLATAVERFNGFARSGVDDDFGRGSYAYDVEWHQQVFSIPNPDTGHDLSEPNVTMAPISGTGPYYAAILVAGTLDTNGGPVTDAHARVLDAYDRAIPGLYGAGNCVASPTGHAYWGGGSTLGPAVAFGYLAGKDAASAPVNVGEVVGTTA